MALLQSTDKTNEGGYNTGGTLTSTSADSYGSFYLGNYYYNNFETLYPVDSYFFYDWGNDIWDTFGFFHILDDSETNDDGDKDEAKVTSDSLSSYELPKINLNPKTDPPTYVNSLTRTKELSNEADVGKLYSGTIDNLSYKKVGGAVTPGRSFDVSWGVPVDGVFKMSISTQDDDDKPFILSFGGGIGSDNNNSSTQSDLTSNMFIDATTYKLHYIESTESSFDPHEKFYIYVIPFELNQNTSRTYNRKIGTSGKAPDPTYVTSIPVNEGITIYISKTNDVIEWVKYDLGLVESKTDEGEIVGITQSSFESQFEGMGFGDPHIVPLTNPKKKYLLPKIDRSVILFNNNDKDNSLLVKGTMFVPQDNKIVKKRKMYYFRYVKFEFNNEYFIIDTETLKLKDFTDVQDLINNSLPDSEQQEIKMNNVKITKQNKLKIRNNLKNKFNSETSRGMIIEFLTNNGKITFTIVSDPLGYPILRSNIILNVERINENYSGSLFRKEIKELNF